MDERIEKLEEEIEAIKGRNVRVESDKAWETSTFRITLITAITYIVASIIFNLIGSQNYLLNALIPTAGYFLSMRSLPAIRKWWIKKQERKQKQEL